ADEVAPEGRRGIAHAETDDVDREEAAPARDVGETEAHSPGRERRHGRELDAERPRVPDQARRAEADRDADREAEGKLARDEPEQVDVSVRAVLHPLDEADRQGDAD